MGKPFHQSLKDLVGFASCSHLVLSFICKSFLHPEIKVFPHFHCHSFHFLAVQRKPSLPISVDQRQFLGPRCLLPTKESFKVGEDFVRASVAVLSQPLCQVIDALLVASLVDEREGKDALVDRAYDSLNLEKILAG